MSAYPPSFIPGNGFDPNWRSPQGVRILPGIWDNPRFDGPGSMNLARSGSPGEGDLARQTAISLLTGNGSRGMPGNTGFGGLGQVLQSGPPRLGGGGSGGPLGRVDMPSITPERPGALPPASSFARTQRGVAPASIARSDLSRVGAPPSFAPPDWNPSGLRDRIDDPLLRVLMKKGGVRY